MSKIGHYIIELKKYECPCCGELMEFSGEKLICYHCNFTFKRRDPDN